MKKGLKILLWIVGILVVLGGLFVLISILLRSATSDPIGLPFDAPCEEDILNCGDFITQEDSQLVYDFCIDEVGRDVHGLDNDGNGVACEGLK